MKKRAIQSEDKETKRKQIVSAARELFDARDFFTVKMEDVAQKAGVAKGTLYLYFSTKEELFLSVAEGDLEAWFADLFGAMESLPSQPPNTPPAELARTLTNMISRSFDAHPNIPRDLSLMFNILEHNVSEEKLLAFKAMLVKKLEDLCERFTSVVHSGTDACWYLQLSIQALVLGAWQLANPPEKVRMAQAGRPDVTKLNPAFGEFFEWSLRHLFGGFLEERPHLTRA